MRFSPTWAYRRSAEDNRQADQPSCGRQPTSRWFLRFCIILGFFFISTAIFAIKGQAALQDSDLQGGSQHSRKLLSANGSSVPASEKCDFESANYPYAFVALYAICVLVFFIALAIICDDFFVPSLEVISEKLDLSEDVAGATFMAAGSSAPELFTSIAGVASESDVGVGTIVGSAVFNILIIIALTSALAGQVLKLDFRPLLRDSTFYALSIGCFIIFSWDGLFEIWESVILLLLYALYIVIMKFNSNIMNLRCWKRSVIEPVLYDEEIGIAEGGNMASLDSGNIGPPQHPPSMHDNPSHHEKHSTQSLMIQDSQQSQKNVFHHFKHGELSSHFSHPHHVHHANERGVWYLFVVKGHPTAPSEKRHSSVHVHGEQKIETEERGDKAAAKSDFNEDEEEDEPALRPLPCLPAINMYYPEKDILGETCGCFRLFLKWLFFFVSFPFVCMFTWTIPNCGNEKYRKWYLASFGISVMWIAGISYVMVIIVIRAGCILNVNHYTMGLVIVAVGTSVPDALSSILVARDGFGDMAVSNAIGSNVFDINLGLGLPFLISSAIKRGAPIYLLNEAEMDMLKSGEMLLTPHAKFGFLLLLILLFTLVVFTCVRFRLSKVVGICFVIMYVLFLVYAFLQEIFCHYDC